MTKAVLFDLDGTLLDTLEDLADSTNAVLEKMRLPVHDVEDYRYFVGDGIHNQARRALPERARDPETVQRCVEGIRAEYARRWANKTRPYDGVPEMLDALHALGVPMSILSNKDQQFAGKVVRRLLAGWSFSVVRGARPGVPLKPDPRAARKIAEQMGCSPEDFVYLGDTATDMKTARAAGMYAVGALWGFRPSDELQAGGAQALIRHPCDLLELMEQVTAP